MDSNKPPKKRKARVDFNEEKDVLLLRAVLNRNPWQQGDKQWQLVVDEIKDKFEREVTIRTVRSRLNTLIKNFNSDELKYKSGVAEEEDSEINNLLRIIIAIEEEEKAATNDKNAAARKRVPTKEVTGKVSGEVADVVVEDVLVEVAGEIPRDIQFEYVQYVDLGAGDDEDLPPRVSAAKQRRLEKAEADLERKRYVDEASGPSTSRQSRQRITMEEELINQRLELDIQIEKKKLTMHQEQLETEKIRATKREDHEIQMDNLKFEMEKQRSEGKLQLEKERLALEKFREARKEQEVARRDEISKMSIDLQSKMIEMLTKVLEK